MQWDELFSERLDYDPAAAEKPALPSGGGVYLFTDQQDRFIQLSSAADLKRAITHRLAPPVAVESPGPESESSPGTTEADAEAAVSAAKPDEQVPAPTAASRKRADLSQIVRRIRWQPAHSAFEIATEYLRISRVVLPGSYLENLAFGPAWFVHVDPAAEIPRFTVAKIVSAGPGTVLGPFATQQDANKFVQVLEDVFDLCRYLHILEQAPHGQPCAYYEMGRCPAPCGGLIPMSEYRQTMATALQFAAGDRQEVLGKWEEQMRQAAGELAFERAAALKQRLARAGELEHQAYRYVRPIWQFNWLIVQRGSGRTRVKPFFVHAGRLSGGEAVRLKELDKAVPEWLQRAKAGADEPPHQGASTREISENIWLVSHFLLRREQLGLFFGIAALPAAEELIETVRERFSISRPESSEQQTPQPPANEHA